MQTAQMLPLQENTKKLTSNSPGPFPYENTLDPLWYTVNP
jgi:hypothetical protein